MDLSNEIVDFLAKNHKANVRQIEGSLNRIYAYSSLSNLQITIPLLKRILPDICKSSNRIVSQEEIVSSVCSYFDLKPNDLLSNSRKKTITLGRHIAMYLSRKLTNASFPAIGKNFGGRDHSTVMHAYEKIDKSINQNSEFERVVSHIENNLTI
jgi:chromosomal replication initiator protein